MVVQKQEAGHAHLINLDESSIKISHYKTEEALELGNKKGQLEIQMTKKQCSTVPLKPQIWEASQKLDRSRTPQADVYSMING